MPKSFLNNPELPRGLRNNNPGNLRAGIPWLGIIGEDADGFLIFENVAYGIRAMATDVGNDMRLDQLRTIRELINEYAPPTENPTEAYIANVSKATGFAPDQLLPQDQETLFKLLRAIIDVEVGPVYKGLITGDDIREGMGLMNPDLLAYFGPGSIRVAGGGIILAVIILGYLFRKQIFKF